MRFRINGPTYLAVLLSMGDRSSLYLYDPEGIVRYQEMLGESRHAIVAVGDPGTLNQYLLIGGKRGRVWR